MIKICVRTPRLDVWKFIAAGLSRVFSEIGPNTFFEDLSAQGVSFSPVPTNYGNAYLDDGSPSLTV